jgi:hypothetical protein
MMKDAVISFARECFSPTGAVDEGVRRGNEILASLSEKQHAVLFFRAAYKKEAISNVAEWVKSVFGSELSHSDFLSLGMAIRRFVLRAVSLVSELRLSLQEKQKEDGVPFLMTGPEISFEDVVAKTEKEQELVNGLKELRFSVVVQRTRLMRMWRESHYSANAFHQSLAFTREMALYRTLLDSLLEQQKKLGELASVPEAYEVNFGKGFDQFALMLKSSGQQEQMLDAIASLVDETQKMIGV